MSRKFYPRREESNPNVRVVGVVEKPHNGQHALCLQQKALERPLNHIAFRYLEISEEGHHFLHCDFMDELSC